jgi:hypothetical protein
VFEMIHNILEINQKQEISFLFILYKIVSKLPNDICELLIFSTKMEKTRGWLKKPSKYKPFFNQMVTKFDFFKKPYNPEKTKRTPYILMVSEFQTYFSLNHILEQYFQIV